VSPVQSHIDEREFISFLEKLKSGDERSWYQLDFVLKRIICKWLKKKSIPIGDSIEIYNAVITVLFEKLSLAQFQTFRNLKSYVFAIAENKLKEYYRTRGKLLRTESLDHEPYCSYIAAISNVSLKDSEEQVLQVKRCLALLTKKERTLLKLVYNEGKSLKEVAGMLSIGESNARVIKHRALGKIRKQIKNGKTGL
jgi:RNA polymerase sigma factor (sigma-70 family)